MSDLLRVIDMHGQFAYWADEEETRRLFRMGYGRGKGTKKRLHSVHLVVPLRIAAEDTDVVNSRDLISIARDRYHFRDRELLHSVGWKLRRIPDWQLHLFGPMTHPDAYQRMRKKPKAVKAVPVTHKSDKKGRR